MPKSGFVRSLSRWILGIGFAKGLSGGAEVEDVATRVESGVGARSKGGADSEIGTKVGWWCCRQLD